MLRPTTIHVESEIDRPSANYAVWGWAAVAVVAFGPLVGEHFANLWRRPHYQFFPVLIAAVIGLVWSRREALQTAAFLPMPGTARTIIVVSLLILTVAVVGSSPWLATAALFLFLAGWVLQTWGASAFRVVAWPWALLWLVMPPPLGLDKRLISALQRFASNAASKLADWLEINHFLEGNVVRLPDRSLFVDEACSGVNSLFAMLAIAGLFAVWKRRAWLHLGLLVLAAIAWATAANLGRLVTIVVAASWYDTDLSSGWQHDALAFAWLLPLLGLLAATDGGLLFLFSSVRTRGNPLTRWWNVWIADPWPWVGPPPAKAAPTDNAALPAETAVPRRRWQLGWLGALVVVQFGLLVVAGRGDQPRLASRASTLNQASLPAELDGWQVIAYREQKRPARHIEGEFSKCWELEKNGRRIVLSFDYPFLAWHELTNCYVGNGWQVDHRETIALDGDGSDAPADYVESQMSKPAGDPGYLLFGLYDRAGLPWSPSHEAWSLSYRIRDKIWHQLKRYGLGEDTYQLQVFTSSDQTMSPPQRAELKSFYRRARDILLDAPQTARDAS